ncbi:MAG: hypothetical protein GX998_08460 [Firmicutes bacterium]|nr:hypothetical protein [Bacillota bacterium]
MVMTDCGQISKDASALWVCLTTNEVAGKLTITYRCGIVSLDFSSVGEARENPARRHFPWHDIIP